MRPKVVIAEYLDEPAHDRAVISVWDINSDDGAQEGRSPPKFTLQGHTASVFDLKFGHTSSTLLSGPLQPTCRDIPTMPDRATHPLQTASADATVACWDLVAGRRSGVVAMDSSVAQLDPCIAGQPHLVLAGLGSTDIGLIDLRTLSW
jgi:WD40 repeat protein